MMKRNTPTVKPGGGRTIFNDAGEFDRTLAAVLGPKELERQRAEALAATVPGMMQVLEELVLLLGEGGSVRHLSAASHATLARRKLIATARP